VPTESFVLASAVDFLEPLSSRKSPYTQSRIAIFQDRTTLPVLHLLAVRRFGSWPEKFFPFWVDGDPTNETLENVALAERMPVVRRKLNLPSGPSYRKAWRRQNVDRVRRYTREAQARQALREALKHSF